MKTSTLKAIFERNIAPALAITEEQASLCNGMSEAVAKKHRDFSKMSKEKQEAAVKKGDV